MNPASKTVFCSVVILLIGCTPLQIQAQGLVTNVAIHIDRQDSGKQTPIQQQYLSLLRSADFGDEIVLLQKYFRNEVLNRAIVDAAVRGVNVLAVYRDELRPGCEKLIPLDSSIDCSEIFIRHEAVHHKSMVLHRLNGRSTAIIGSFNIRERHLNSPRAHTALSFDIESDNTFFGFYMAHAKRLLGIPSDVEENLTMATEGGGNMSFTFHPGKGKTLLGLLQRISECKGPLWLSYYRAVPDAFGKPIFERLGQLARQGCDVRFLLDRDKDNQVVEQELRSLGVSVHYPNEHDGKVTLGHKLVMVRSNGRLWLSQSSANLDQASHESQYNLTLQLNGDFPDIEKSLEAELRRYW